MFLDQLESTSLGHWLDRPRWRVVPWWLIEPRQSNHKSLLQILAMGQQERLDLVPLLRAFAGENRGRYRKKLHMLADRLESETPLVDALEQTVDVLSDRDVLRLRLAAQSGTLNRTLSELANQPAESAALPASLLVRRALLYGLIMFVVAAVMALFLNEKIVPVCMQMLEENIPNPSVMGAYSPLTLFRRTFQWAFGMLPGLVAILVAAFLLWRFSGLPVWIRRRFGAGVTVHKLSLWKADLLDLIADTLHTGRPLPGAISTLARYHFNPTLRQRLLLARNEIEHGVPVWESLGQARLLDPEQATAFGKMESSELQAWLATQLANTQRQRLQSRQTGWATFLQPALVLIFGGIVLWICSVFFRFLVFFDMAQIG